MGKKSRSAPCRRPILQLSPPAPRREDAGPAPQPPEGAESGSEPDEPEAGPEPPRSAPHPPPPAPAAVKPTGGLCLLGAYADSDDEEGEASEKSARSGDANGNNSADIDSTLANFLAEIDAITAPPQPAEPAAVPPPTPPRPEPKEPSAGQPPGTASANGTDAAPAPEWQYDTQCSLAGVGELEMGDWQEVWDENTGCYYYWNTQSNEVTWELPPYLAAQVQGLQHYQHSAAAAGANGSFAASAELYPQEKGAAAGGRGAGLAKPVKKEVNEGVQALSNSEEEKKGVAAALLAPLLPDVVKEEEERWRRKVICKEEVEPPPEEEAKAEEAAAVAAAAAAAPEEPEAGRDPLEDTLQEELCSVVQSGESGEEEEEQDTLELEMVLERKKAELRALEEGDGSVSGSSPLSDGSQSASQDATRRLASKRGKWKLFVGAASPESTSRGSSKTGRESPEAGEAAAGTEAPDVHSDKEAESEEPQEKAKAQGAPKIEEEEQDLKFQIGELANTLTSKLEFLGINRQSISNFHMLLLQTETRIADWREGALNGNYLKRKLQDAAEQLKQYEINATPKGWSCHWDREHRRYFYVNEHSGESQWEFPDGEDEDEGQQSTDRKADGPPKPPPKEKGERAGDAAERSAVLCPGPPTSLAFGNASAASASTRFAPAAAATTPATAWRRRRDPGSGDGRRGGRGAACPGNRRRRSPEASPAPGCQQQPGSRRTQPCPAALRQASEAESRRDEPGADAANGHHRQLPRHLQPAPHGRQQVPAFGRAPRLPEATPAAAGRAPRPRQPPPRAGPRRWPPACQPGHAARLLGGDGACGTFPHELLGVCRACQPRRRPRCAAGPGARIPARHQHCRAAAAPPAAPNAPTSHPQGAAAA
ncbi:formin-binding protein 4 isoform X3 [Anas platyrhynchos]|uniref:formin-binding protein 4 isoform X3 n=1 Tax=Anas platyrhynchos TaxID=8839 RepID=UPI003AF2FF32